MTSEIKMFSYDIGIEVGLGKGVGAVVGVGVAVGNGVGVTVGVTTQFVPERLNNPSDDVPEVQVRWSSRRKNERFGPGFVE
jgi:hypothetical protein